MKQYHAEILEDQTVNIDTKAVRKSGVVDDGSLTSWLYIHWDTLKDFIRRITGINNVIRVKAVFTSNITISASGATVDGYTLLNNDIVLVAGQTDSTQNGLYTWATGGALTRLAPFTSTFAAGLAILNIALQGRIFHVLNGNINRNTFWYFDSPTQFPVIGTSNLLFYNVANLKVSTASNNLIVSGTDGIEVKLKNSGTVNGGADAVFGGLQYDAATREFYIITSLMPGASGSLTIENYLGTILGIASKMRFGIEFTTVWDGANSRITVALAAGLGVQVGTVIYEAFDIAAVPAAPAGYLLCNGQTVDGDNALYTALRTKLQSTFITNLEINRPPLEPSVVLTSNSQAGYISSCSTEFLANTAYWAFDGTTNTWISGLWSSTTTPATVGGDWIKLQLPSAIKFESLFFVLPINCALWGSFQASNNNSTWTTLSTLNNNAGGTITISDTTPYMYYRFLITQIAAGQNRVQIQDISFRRPLISPIRYFQVPNLPSIYNGSAFVSGTRAIIKI